jgi:hypothetical protein
MVKQSGLAGGRTDILSQLKICCSWFPSPEFAFETFSY